jgi:hypothetical protein
MVILPKLDFFLTCPESGQVQEIMPVSQVSSRDQKDNAD